MTDLYGEMRAAAALVTPQMRKSTGLDWQDIGMVRAEVHDDGTYEPSESGNALWVVPVHYGPPEASYLCDLVAWHHSNPLRWWRRTLYGNILGFLNVQHCRQAVWDFGGAEPPRQQPLWLYPDPKSYILAGCDGACVLDPKFGYDELEGVEQIACHDQQFAREIRKQLQSTLRPLPTVLWNDSATEAA